MFRAQGRSPVEIKRRVDDVPPHHLRAQSHSPVEIKEMVAGKSLDASLNASSKASLTASWSIVH
eukprot:4064944-Pleurochrysis_carterae.AAC.1